ncbi:two-component system response regulator [Allomuricauda sp. CP2A]|jgi:CheY-like chemotaxis protein|uniref:response regulator n=1 Tax=Allomuricauda sp. CP2A TaxID=1848189 RepID=UPI0008311015|nr:response regulator [Muricauda sp. CP2A]
MTKEILLIDDDAITNFLNQNLIEQKIKGIPITIFYNGLEGLKHIKNNPDRHYIVFLDINMPVMNGWEFLEAVNSLTVETSVEIHVLTSSINPGDRDRANGLPNVASFIEKPLDELAMESFMVAKLKKPL